MNDEKDIAQISEPVRLVRESLWGDDNRFLKICRSLPGEIVIGVLLYFLLQRLLVPLIGSFAVNNVLYPLMGDSLRDYIVPIQAYSEIIMMAGFILYMRFAERRKLPAMGFIRKKALLNYLLGLIAGFVVFSIILLVSVAITGGSIAFSEKLSPGMLLFALIGFMVQGMAEEVEARSYIFLSVSRKHKAYVGILVSGILFGMIHLNNTGTTVVSVLNTTLIGFAFCLMFMASESLWFIGAFHTIWNFAQGNIYGIAVSGNDAGDSIFAATLGGENTLLTGGAYGVEGNVITTIVVLN